MTISINPANTATAVARVVNAAAAPALQDATDNERPAEPGVTVTLSARGLKAAAADRVEQNKKLPASQKADAEAKEKEADEKKADKKEKVEKEEKPR